MREALAVVLALSALPAGAQTLDPRMLAAEDARVTLAAEIAPLVAGLHSTDPRVVLQAVRALGRFERPALITQILPVATHVKPDVRAEALNALGQSLAAIPRAADDPASLPPEVAAVRATLAAHIRTDPHPYVTGVAAETLGRLPYRTAASVAEAGVQIASLLPPGQSASPMTAGAEPLVRVVHPEAVTGAVKGLETLVRVYQKLQPPSPDILARLRSAATLGSDPSDGDFAYIRRVAWLALNAAAAADAALVEHGLDDPDAQVRRLAVLSVATATDIEPHRPALLARALRDHSFTVRYDAVRTYSRTLQAENCAPVLAAADDENAHVALAAIDALGNGCADAVPKLARIADELPNPNEPGTRNLEHEPGTGNLEPGTAGWHRAAHAIVALSRVAHDQATPRLARFAEHPTWQVRMYAAQAAEALVAVARLERLAADPNDNVREAAVRGLMKVRGHDADAIYIEQLARRDYQLVMTAATALKGTTQAAALPALTNAFTRITAEARDTSRDARVALVERIRELGGVAAAAKLEGGTPVTQTPKVALKPVGVPAVRRMRITMRRGGSFDLRLFPDEAPATIARVVALARKGYYNGLTFHRVVPNFVLQGGSPGANEYMGDGPFMRDELGLRTHARGTLGISTRGRDTGDAQIFVNLLDNPRLDHNFTVFAEITAGMEVVDAVLEGDVIERVDVFEQASTQHRP
jgi:cyclophilin family peptidyl-prolyl cis-trans isomerase/HEAT repeat protein